MTPIPTERLEAIQEKSMTVLSQLFPKFYGFSGATDSKVKLGMTFLCPHCMDHRLAVAFANPIDPDDVLRDATPLVRSIAWQRAGETFGNITLTPSIDFSGHGHWHGLIVDGQVFTA